MEEVLVKRVLVFDGNRGMGERLAAHLKRDGHSVTSTSAGLEVLKDFYDQARYDVYVIDIHEDRGALDGLWLANFIGERLPSAAIILVTEDARLAGAQEFEGRPVFTEPIDYTSLSRAVAA
jgi:DNA-binding NtrC family response regulator